MLNGLIMELNQQDDRTERGGEGDQGGGVWRDAGRGGQQGRVLCRICQAAGMLPSAYTSHGTAQCGALSAWDRRDIYVVLRGEYGQVEQNQFNDEGQESQPDSA